MRAARKLILGETWALPIGVALTLAAGLALEALAGSAGWWRHAGGFLLLALVVAALWSALPRGAARRTAAAGRAADGGGADGGPGD